MISPKNGRNPFTRIASKMEDWGPELSLAANLFNCGRWHAPEILDDEQRQLTKGLLPHFKKVR